MPDKKFFAAAAFLVVIALVPGANAECAADIDGQSIDAMIEQAGGIASLLEATNAQLAEFDKWFEQMKPALHTGVRQKEVQAVYAECVLVRDQNAKLRDALLCRKGG